MKRVIGAILLIALSLQSCVFINRDHNDRLYNADGYMRNLVELYYLNVLQDWERSSKGEDPYYGNEFTRLGDNVWSCHITEEQDNSPGKNRRQDNLDEYSCDITVTITESAGAINYQVSGYRIEKDYRITITSPEGVFDQTGVIRAEIVHDGIPEGWCEAHITPSQSYNNIEYTSGEF